MNGAELGGYKPESFVYPRVNPEAIENLNSIAQANRQFVTDARTEAVLTSRVTRAMSRIRN